jgi:hypothetical protein
MIQDVYPESRIRIFAIPDPDSEVKKAQDPGSGSATLDNQCNDFVI